MILAAFALLGPLIATALILILRRGAAGIALFGAGIGALAAVATLVRVAGGERFAASLPGLPTYGLRLTVDPLAAVVSTVVAVVASLVFVYAVGYMESEPGQTRFYADMSFFVAAMQALVLAGDWVLLLAAWEVIGFASYLLIGFWYDRPGVGAAATRAFLTTRAADFGLYLGIFLLVTRSGTTVIADTFGVGGSTATLAGVLLLIGAMGKSAQVPFQGWLQDAMAGPTPVSALLHSATLVAAGAYLLIRVSPLLTPDARLMVGIVGGITALIAGITALAQQDVKRCLAASTSSQLGFMFLAVGAGAPVAAVFHLIAHAAIKSALFQGAGIFQHTRGATAFARLGGVGRTHRGIYAGFTVAALALAGVPPLAGFRSKDTIIAATFAAPGAALLAPFALVGTLLTGAYMARALRLLWRGEGADRPVAGRGWMGAGMTVLVAFAATLGSAAPPLSRLLGMTLPESTLPVVAALLMALLGLLIGWIAPAEWIPERFRLVAETGFRVGDGVLTFIVRPVLALSHRADRFERVLGGSTQSIGRRVAHLAYRADVADARLQAGVQAVGNAGQMLARLSRIFDERVIDGLIAALVRGIRALDARARALQSGFVSRELVFAVGGAALLVLLLMLFR